MTHQFVQAVILGLIEGITEFLPISSTGHMILAERLFGWQQMPGQVFEIVIQLGAILAICVLYRQRLITVVQRLPHDRAARHFVWSLLIAFLPAMILGALLHDVVKAKLFSPWVVSWSLIIGGIAIIAIEKYVKLADRYHDVERLPVEISFKIGLMQCLALVPGVSRSGATIMGARVLGVVRQTAAEFSFFLAVPTMLAATVFDLYKNRAVLSGDDIAIMAVGFITAFLAALLVVKWLLRFIMGHDFTLFGWYRITAGLVMLALLYFR